ncbi:Uncharacterised protein [Legionella donaldsonii]|uniref:Uncharacterized protein n=1 Tax=Legionella donaldsonii TaxID=45060 RepID=A0A378J771_9GAMM|nr:hypothetical protein [Legionella donaldsonii]STX42821.1 Uncharacterised protein [Legionella donaldsonii]
MSTNQLDVRLAHTELLFLFKTYIQANIPAIGPKYANYPNETGVNPALESIKEVRQRLRVNEKRSFAIRSDCTLVTGVKNAYQEYNYHGLRDVLDESVHQYVNWQDRYGHPSLAGEDGKLLYAGFVCQRKNYLEIFLSSGRFNRVDRQSEGIEPLTEDQVTVIETYLVLQFNKAYGTQPVIVYDTLPGQQDDEDSALFFMDKPFPQNKKYRKYSQSSISSAVAIIEIDAKYRNAQHYIQKNISPVKPKYSYSNENNINPAYQEIHCVEAALQPFEKRIWVLRSDFILATGVKNAYQKEFGYTGLADTFSKALHRFLDWDDRYGHPSLTLATDTYDGGVFYAGYICQRKGYLQVYLASGRYDRTDLTTEQTAVLEAYIAAQFQVAYGNQEIVFDYANPDDSFYHTTFFSHGIFPKTNPQRRYTQTLIRDILNGINSDSDHLKNISTSEKEEDMATNTGIYNPS